MGNLWDNIKAGAIAGIASGLILASIFWLKSCNDEHTERRDQVKYLSDLIAGFRTQILDTKEDVFVPRTNQTLSRNNIRKVLYDDLRRQLESALAGRSSRLTYDEIREVHNVFIGLHKLYPKFIPNEEWYINTFQKAESINWLKLTPATRTPKKK